MSINQSAASEQPAWVPGTATFGSRLAMLRQIMGWNMKEAALACGIPPASWRQWEIMGSLPRNVVTVSQQIADYTAVDGLWLLTGTPAQSSVEVEGFGKLQEWAVSAGVVRPWNDPSECTPSDLNREPTDSGWGALATVVDIDTARSLRVPAVPLDAA